MISVSLQRQMHAFLWMPASYCFNTVLFNALRLVGACLLALSLLAPALLPFKGPVHQMMWISVLFLAVYCGICCLKRFLLLFFMKNKWRFVHAQQCLSLGCTSSFISVYSTLCGLVPKCVREQLIKPLTPICQLLLSATPGSFFGSKQLQKLALFRTKDQSNWRWWVKSGCVV